MTVTELLERIISAYPGATAEAMASFKPVFYARLRDREGDALGTAAVEVLASFRPKRDQPFPIPADFEAHLPSRRLNLGHEAPIREKLEQRKRRRDAQFAAWHAGQGAAIKASKPEAVYAACVREAMVMSPREAPLLTREEYALCEERALAAARVHVFGALPKDNNIWNAQREEIRSTWTQKREAA